MAFLWPNFALLLWETFTICNSCLSLSCIVYCSSNSCTDSLSFSVLSKVSFTFPHALAFSSCFSWFILRLLQRRDWTWDDWLLTLCTTRFVHQTCIFCHQYLCTNSWLHVLCICCSCYCTVANTVNPFKNMCVFLPSTRFGISYNYQPALHFSSRYRYCKCERTCAPPCYPCTCNIVPFCHFAL